MSYSLQTTCWNCIKKEECKDANKIQKGINEIHTSNDGHLGSGCIIIQCANHTKEGI